MFMIKGMLVVFVILMLTIVVAFLKKEISIKIGGDEDHA